MKIGGVNRMKTEKIAIGSDHGGFELKEFVKDYLHTEGYEVEDFGTYDENSCDYPDFAYPVAKAVAEHKFDKGIVICGTGIGVSIVANKVKGIRCALVHDCFTAKATRQHNDTNVLAMGARVIGKGLAQEIVETWLNNEFEGGRHKKRVDKIKAVEDEN